jgi:K+-sensing histidine kinase KdpD
MPQTTSQPAEVFVFERGLWSRAWFMVLLCVVFVTLDWTLVPVWVFPFIFVFPVMLVAWNRSLWFAVICASVLSLTRMAHQFVFEPHPMILGELGDALIRFFVMMLLAVLTSQLGRQSRQLRQRVRLLEGILPICAWCKNIRDENNNWVQLEGYITEHSEAHFSHSLCPECFEKYSGQKPPAGPPAK